MRHAARMEEIKMHTEFCSENLKGRDHLGEIGLDWGIIFKLIGNML